MVEPIKHVVRENLNQCAIWTQTGNGNRHGTNGGAVAGRGNGGRGFGRVRANGAFQANLAGLRVLRGIRGGQHRSNATKT